MKPHYDWNEMFTYNPDVAMVVGGRDIGKTFGLREQFIRDYINHGERFCGVCRYEKDIPTISEDYLKAVSLDTEDAKIRKWFDENKPVFRMQKGALKVGSRKESDKIKEWDTIGYFAHMSVKQASKERTFLKVRRFVVDEAIMDPEDLRFRRYLRDEWGRLQNIVKSATKVGQHRTEPNIYLLGNSVDLLNPWFEEFGINDIPPFGKRWLLGGLVLLDYVDQDEYMTRNMQEGGTLASRMLDHRAKDSAVLFGNRFATDTKEFIEKRTRGARYECAYIYRDKIYGVWTDWARGISYVTNKCVKGAGCVYAMTTQDNKVNYIAAKQARKSLMEFADRYGLGIVRFESVALREGFVRLLRDFGIK